MNITTITFLAITSAGYAASSTAQDLITGDWQQRRLLSPTTQEFVAEQQGKVVIYDGLHETMVDRALDDHFTRIGAMMFVQVQHTEPNGETWGDDDCD